MTEELPFCACGKCGLRVSKKGNRFIWGHNRLGNKNSPEHNAAVSKALTGVQQSLEHIAATINGMGEAGAYDKMRGGNDLVNHHYIYDESDLSLNTVQMTRSDHSRLHWLLERLGYIVPHINVKEELL